MVYILIYYFISALQFTMALISKLNVCLNLNSLKSGIDNQILIEVYNYFDTLLLFD